MFRSSHRYMTSHYYNGYLHVSITFSGVGIGEADWNETITVPTWSNVSIKTNKQCSGVLYIHSVVYLFSPTCALENPLHVRIYVSRAYIIIWAIYRFHEWISLIMFWLFSEFPAWLPEYSCSLTWRVAIDTVSRIPLFLIDCSITVYPGTCSDPIPVIPFPRCIHR